MKKIFFAFAIVVFACTFISCDADSVNDELSTIDGIDNPNDSGGPGGSGATTPITPPPPPPPPKK